MSGCLVVSSFFVVLLWGVLPARFMLKRMLRDRILAGHFEQTCNHNRCVLATLVGIVSAVASLALGVITTREPAAIILVPMGAVILPALVTAQLWFVAQTAAWRRWPFPIEDVDTAVTITCIANVMLGVIFGFWLELRFASAFDVGVPY